VNDVIADAMAAPPPGEHRAGVQVAHFRVQDGQQHGTNHYPNLQAAADALETAKATHAAWTAQVIALRGDISRLRNLVLTCSGLRGGRDRNSANHDLATAEAFLAEGLAGLAAAQREVAELESWFSLEAAKL
jgi:hypothetical protein